MRNAAKILTGSEGYILIAAVVVTLAVSGLAAIGAFNSSRNLTANRSMVTRAKSFYASDGLITMVCQDMIDGDFQKYLFAHGLDSVVSIGATTQASKKHGDPFKDTLKARGTGLQDGADAGVYFAYTRVSGPFDMKVKVCSFSGATDAKVGLMVRASKATNSRDVLMCLNNGSPVQASLRFRLADGGGYFNNDVTRDAAATYWLRLERAGSNYVVGYCSTNGKSWWEVSRVQCDLGSTVYAGLFVSPAATGTTCTAAFDSLNLGFASGTYSMGGATVSYRIDQALDGGYDLTATTGTARLKQHFALMSTPVSRPATGYLHYVLYDYHIDGRNPNFWSNANRFTTGGIVQNSLTTGDRKPLRARDKSQKLLCRVKRWYDYWFTRSGNSLMMDLEVDGQGDPTDCTPAAMAPPGCVDRLNEWFRVSGPGGPDNTVSFVNVGGDPGNSKWRWKKSDGSDLDSLPGYGGVFVGPQSKAYIDSHGGADDTARMANLVVYDSFYMTLTPCYGEDVMGDLINQACPPGTYIYSSSMHELNVYPGDMDYLHSVFQPLFKRGWKGEKAHVLAGWSNCSSGYGPCTAADHMEEDDLTPAQKTARQFRNLGWAMELHTQFTYHAGEGQFYHAVRGPSGHFWTFVNGKLAIDMGSMSNGAVNYVKLDSVASAYGMSDGGIYWADIFIAQTQSEGEVSDSGWCDFSIYTNMDFFSPKLTRSNWRRDYGRLD